MNVGALPRRTAHAAYALLVSSIERNSPVLASEIVVFDEEALNARSTGAALGSARRYGLATYTGRYWIPTNLAYGLRLDLETRFLDETKRDTDG